MQEHPDDAELDAQLKPVESEMSDCLADLWTRRSEYVQVCQEAEQYEPAEREVRAWLAEHPDVAQLKDWLIELLLGANKADQALEILTGYTAQTPADVLKVFSWRAQAYAQNERVDEAVRDLEGLLGEQFVQNSPPGPQSGARRDRAAPGQV